LKGLKSEKANPTLIATLTVGGKSLIRASHDRQNNRAKQNNENVGKNKNE